MNLKTLATYGVLTLESLLMAGLPATRAQADPTIRANTQIQVDQDGSQESTTRFGLDDLPEGFSAKNYLIKEKDADGNLVEQEAGGWLAKTTDIKDSTVSNTSYIRPTQTIEDGVKENKLNLGTEFVIKGDNWSAYALPAWLTIDEDGLSSSFMLGTFSTPKMELGAAYEIVKDDGDAMAAYGIAKFGESGVGISKYFGDPVISAQAAVNTGKFGSLAWGTYDWDTNDIYVSLFAAENPTGLLTVDGISTLASVLAIGQPQEISPYFTSASTKSTGGTAGRLEIEREEGEWTVTPHIGFRQGDIGVAVNQAFNIKGDRFASGPAQFVGTYASKPIVVEMKYDTDGNITVYGGLTCRVNGL